MSAVREIPSRTWTVRVLVVLMTLVACCAAFVLAAPSSARAATQAVQFSTDGIHWSDSYTGHLFGGLLIVPNTSATRSFYVRNAAEEDADLRITLYGVSTNDIDLASAMAISSSAPGFAGATVPVTSAQPCYTLNEGLRLASGGSVRIDNTVSLGNLNGTVGQSRSVGFGLLVSLSSTDSAAPTPNTCPTNSGSVALLPDPVIPTPPAPVDPASAADVATPAATVYRRTAAGWTPVTSSGAGSAIIVSPTTPTTPEEPNTPLVQTLVSNTARFYQEYDVAFWLAMSVIGALVAVIARRRRADDQPAEPSQSRQIGSDR